MSGPGDAPLTEEEREALFRAGDHHPDVCDCTGRAEEVRYEPGWGEVCGAFADTLTAVERILAARRADDTQAARDRAAVEAVKRLAADYEVIAGHNPAAWKQYLYVAQDLRAALAAAQTETTP